MNKLGALVAAISVATLLGACSNATKLSTQPMPKSGFLPNYSLLVPVATSESDTRIWRYRKAGVNPGSYTARRVQSITRSMRNLGGTSYLMNL